MVGRQEGTDDGLGDRGQEQITAKLALNPYIDHVSAVIRAVAAP